MPLAASLASGATLFASIPTNAEARLVRSLNSMALEKAISRCGLTPSRHEAPTRQSWWISRSSGTRSSSRTSLFDMRACSANSIKDCRRFSCLISPARPSNVSRSPYSLMSSAAVFTPRPGTPGTLSVESPISDCTSGTFSGGTPNFSITSSRPIGRSRPGIGSNIWTPGRTSCIRSLSPATIIASAPASTARRA